MRGSTKAILTFMVIAAAAVFILGMTHPNGITIDLKEKARSKGANF